MPVGRSGCPLPDIQDKIHIVIIFLRFLLPVVLFVQILKADIRPDFYIVQIFDKTV